MGRRGEHSKVELAAMALDAAVGLLEDEGPDRLTTRAVASRIGYTVGSLYFLFRNRDDLIMQVNERTLTELRVELDRAMIGCDDADTGLRRMGRAYLAFAQRHPARWRLVFEHDPGDDVPLPPRLRGRIDDLFRLVAGQLVARRPPVPGADVALAAQSLWGGVHGITVLAVTGKLYAGGGAAADVLVDELVSRYLAGLGGSG